MVKTPLTSRQAKFVNSFTTGKTAAEAAREAGYTKNYASEAASRVLKNPKVAEAISTAQEKVREIAVYDTARAMQEALEVIEFAKAHGQGMAFFKAVEHRAKLSGLL